MNITSKDFLFFHRMITPIIIKVIFWVVAIIAVIDGLINIFQGDFFYGLMVLVLGPLFVRVFCEMLILAFSINDNLFEVRTILTKQFDLISACHATAKSAAKPAPKPTVTITEITPKTPKKAAPKKRRPAKKVTKVAKPTKKIE